MKFSEVEQDLRRRLAELAPLKLDIVDWSHLHTGHGAEGVHVGLLLVSESFRDQSQLGRHRMIYELVSDLIPRQIHAISIEALSPEENTASR